MLHINTENYGTITFTEHTFDGWLGSDIKRKYEVIKTINFNITKDCFEKYFKDSDFEEKLKNCINFYFQNEKNMINIALRFLEQVLLINEDFDGKSIFEEKIKEDLESITVEIMNLFEYKFAINFSLYNGYIDCNVIINHISGNRFLVTRLDYNWVYHRF